MTPMRLVLLVALSICMTGVALTAAAPTASACIPPNCPGFGHCKVRWEYVSEDTRIPTGLDCYY